MNRRELLGLMAAAATARAQNTIDTAIVMHHDESVERLLAAQITDPSSRGYGALPSATGLYTAWAAASLVEACMAGYLHPQSRFHGNNLLPARIKLATQF